MKDKIYEQEEEKERTFFFACLSVILLVGSWAGEIKMCPHVVRFYKQIVARPAGSACKIVKADEEEDTRSRHRREIK